MIFFLVWQEGVFHLLFQHGLLSDQKVAPSFTHLADSDDSLLGDFVSEDVKHVHAVSTDNCEKHLSVRPNVSVGGLDSPDWSTRLG